MDFKEDAQLGYCEFAALYLSHAKMFSEGVLQFDLKIGHPYRSQSTGPEEKKHFHNKERLGWLHNQSSFTYSEAKLLSSTHLPLPITSDEGMVKHGSLIALQDT